MKDFEKRVIDVMIYEKIIPSTGIFQISQSHLNSYIELYGEIFGKKDNTAKGLRGNQEYKFARKLAGRTLVKLLLDRGAKFNDVLAGMVYMIQNPAYPDHYKIGMTLDVIDRLAQYQTYDPYRKFELVKYNFVLNRKHKEELILNHPDLTSESGEWVLKKNAENVFLQLTKI